MKVRVAQNRFCVDSRFLTSHVTRIVAVTRRDTWYGSSLSTPLAHDTEDVT